MSGMWTIFFLLVATSAHAELVTMNVEYRHGETVLEGYLAWDTAVEGRRPGVIVVHEWKGLNEYAKGRADRLAKLGYAAFAIDMYGKGVRAKTHEEAGRLSGVYRKDRALMRDRAKSALDFFRKRPEVDRGKIAAIGYCFGGTTVLEMARAGMDVTGVASFHGGLDTPNPEETRGVKARILVLHGADDSFVNAAVPAFQEEMRASGADWQMILYGGAVHSFTVPDAGDDPSKGAAYNADADRRSWGAMKDFLAECFAQPD